MGNVCVSVMFIRACMCMPQLNRKLQTAIDDKDSQLDEMQVCSTCNHVWDMSVNALTDSVQLNTRTGNQKNCNR